MPTHRVANLKIINKMINSVMSNIITPLDNIDFTATLAEIKPYLEDRIIAMPVIPNWSDIYLVVADAADLSITNSVLTDLNQSILSVVYTETQGGVEYYQGSQPNSCIILPLEATGSILRAYSAPLGSTRLEDLPNGYHKEDCTLLETHSLDGPVFTGCAVDGAELVFSFQVPEGQVFKSVIIFLNEDTI
jgi:hypothetical protein